MPRTVLLQHTLPDGTWHYDWLIARDGDRAGVGAGPVISFRVDERIDAWPGGAGVTLERLPDHRPLYLAYEGPVAGGRGRVERIAEGTCQVTVEGSDRVVFQADFGAGLRTWECVQEPEQDPPSSVRLWKGEAA